MGEGGEWERAVGGREGGWVAERVVGRRVHVGGRELRVVDGLVGW